MIEHNCMTFSSSLNIEKIWTKYLHFINVAILFMKKFQVLKKCK